MEHPLTEIEFIHPILASRGYRIWRGVYRDWVYGWNAHLFSQKYWGEKTQSILITGMYLSIFYEPEVEDVLFVVTQTYNHATKKESPEMSSEERQAFYSLVADMDIPQLDDFKKLPVSKRDEYLQEREQVFQDCFIARCLEDGTYQRVFNDIDKYPIEWPSKDGTPCPKCGMVDSRNRLFTKISSFQIEKGLDFCNLKCRLCGGLFGLRIASATYRD